jgi:hypothetical protein
MALFRVCLPRAAPGARTRQQSTAPIFNFTFYRSTKSNSKIRFRLSEQKKKGFLVADIFH